MRGLPRWCLKQPDSMASIDLVFGARRDHDNKSGCQDEQNQKQKQQGFIGRFAGRRAGGETGGTAGPAGIAGAEGMAGIDGACPPAPRSRRAERSREAWR